jgi:hypothetical protein
VPDVQNHGIDTEVKNGVQVSYITFLTLKRVEFLFLCVMNARIRSAFAPYALNRDEHQRRRKSRPDRWEMVVDIATKSFIREISCISI